MKKVFLVFGTNARLKELDGGCGCGNHTSGNSQFNVPPQGAKPPTDADGR